MLKHLMRSAMLALLGTLTPMAHADQKAIVVGIDGVQLEKLQALYLPNMARLTLRKAYTGGITGTGTTQPTVSGPGWSTILTGVWMNKHKVTSNSSGLANPLYPSLFKRIRDAKPSAYIASVTNWTAINQQFFAQDVATNDYTASGLKDPEVIRQVVELIRTAPSDFIFLALDDPDAAGHSSGFGSAYNDALRLADARLGQILDAVDQKRNQTGDDWLVLVVTDHGREASGYGHGSQTMNEKTIFISSNKAMNAEFNLYVEGLPNQDFNGLYGNLAQTWIAPTVLRHLGIEPQASWLLDGAPLLGQEAVRKVLPSTHPNATFTWLNPGGQTVDVWRDNAYLTQVSGGQEAYFDSTATPGRHDYTLDVNGTPISVRAGKVMIRGTLDWDSTRSYFFLQDGSYVRYNQVLDRVESGYPLPVDEHTWPGIEAYSSQIIGGFSKDASVAYFFLNDGRYLRYDKAADRVVSGYPKPINDSTWPGLGTYATQIAATLRWTGAKVQFFLKNGYYLRYDLDADRVDNGYPKAVDRSNWPGLEAYGTQINAALKWDDTRAYFFLKDGRYLRFNITLDRMEPDYPRPVDESTWPGVEQQ